MLEWLHRSRFRFGVAVGEGFLLALRWSFGSPKCASVETRRQDMPTDLISVSPVEPNIRAVSKLAMLAGKALEELDGAGRQVAMILPDLALRTFVFPADRKISPTEIVAEMAPRLPYPQTEARFDTWQAPTGWTLAAAIRLVVLRQYEQALEALGCHVSYVDGASLVRLPEWARRAQHEASQDDSDGLRVHVQLYPRHYSLAVMRCADLLDVRIKLRDGEDEPRIAEQLFRLPSLFGGVRDPAVSVRGAGATRLARQLEDGGINPNHVELGEEGEEAHLQSLLEILLGRI